MKIIDLLNKIANKEKLPEEIECYNQTFYLSDNLYIASYQKEKYLDDYIDLSSLNYEVKILEDTPTFKGFKVKDEEIIYKEDKKIEYIEPSETMMENHINIMKKLNEIIDKINGDEENEN